MRLFGNGRLRPLVLARYRKNRLITVGFNYVHQVSGGMGLDPSGISLGESKSLIGTGVGSIENYVPHRSPLLLLDAVQEFTEEGCRTTLRVDPDAWYAQVDGSLPGWFGMELMAQTVAAYSGHARRLQQQSPRIGYLLGAQSYECHVEAFPAGGLLEVDSHLVFNDGQGLCAFQCGIKAAGQTVASAVLKVFEEP